jgi:hypothetical protein
LYLVADQRPKSSHSSRMTGIGTPISHKIQPLPIYIPPLISGA